MLSERVQKGVVRSTGSLNLACASMFFMDDDAMKKAATEALVAVAKEGYNDIGHPVASEIGQILKTGGSLVRLAFRPVNTLLEAGHAYFDGVDKRLRQRLKREPPENIVEPPPYVAGPLLLNHAFVKDQPELRDLFEELLAKSMLVGSRPAIHPSFVDILKQLSPDEARLLPSLATAPRHGCIKAIFYTEPAPPPLPTNTAPFGSRPTVSPEQAMEAFKLRQKPRPIAGDILVTFFAERTTLEAPDVNSVERALGNLARLGLVTVTNFRIPDATDYDEIRNSGAMREAETHAKLFGYYIEAIEKILEVTPFAAQFLKACLPPPNVGT